MSDYLLRGRKVFLIRALALLCACSLSIGSHYGAYILGPLKSRISQELGTSNSEFSLLLAAFSLNSTWTPLVGGLLAARLGTTLSSIIATSLILAGQVILLVGDLAGNVRAMTLGVFIFGLGFSPLSVVQETIIVRFFHGHGLGLSLALGLMVGKGTSFISARTSFPLSEWNPHGPFIVATLLAAFSFSINLIYVYMSKWIAREAGVEVEAAERTSEGAVVLEAVSEEEALRKVTEKKIVRLEDLTRMGDIFWTYIAINVLCGAIWTPFAHLSSNIIERRYNLTASDATSQASLLLAGHMFLYPIVGYTTDHIKTGFIVHKLLILGSVLTFLCYFWLVLPPSLTRTPFPAMLSFGVGQGFSTLLLVLIVPRLVPLKYVSTALGAHKAIESCGITIMQTTSGLVLDARQKDKAIGARIIADDGGRAIQTVLNTFLWLNVLQLLGMLSLLHKDQSIRRKFTPDPGTYSAPYQPLLNEDEEGVRGTGRESFDLDGTEDQRLRHSIHSLTQSPSLAQTEVEEVIRTDAELKRGRIFAILAGSMVGFTWVLFMATAAFKLGFATPPT